MNAMIEPQTEPVQARRNPGALSPSRSAKAAYGPYCDAVRRLACLTPTQAEVARFVAWATLRQGYTSLGFASLAELTQVRAHARPFAGLGKNDLSPALLALARLGMVKVEERSAMESGVAPVTLLLVIADVSQWAVPADGWRFSELEEQELLNHLLACRRRWTAQLPELAEEADLHDARAALAVDDANQGNDEARDAREFCSDQNKGRAACRSESRNAETPVFTRVVPKVGTPLRLKISPKEDPKLKL